MFSRHRLGLTVGLLAVLGAGCDGGALPDAGIADRAGCLDDSDCDDGVFCNGAERCEPAASGADARGCTAEAACPQGTPCDEESAECGPVCPTPDADGDGHDAVACGGDDCDDADPRRFAGNVELCDLEGIDEDCDPATFGERDVDGDGYVDARCCNGETCGEDCDETRRDEPGCSRGVRRPGQRLRRSGGRGAARGALRGRGPRPPR